MKQNEKKARRENKQLIKCQSSIKNTNKKSSYFFGIFFNSNILIIYTDGEKKVCIGTTLTEHNERNTKYFSTLSRGVKKKTDRVHALIWK